MRDSYMIKKKKAVAKKKEKVVKPKVVKNNKPLIEALFQLGHKWCVICGAPSVTFSHLFKDNHMKGNSRWDYDNKENGVLMCTTCHQRFDGCSNILDLNDPTTRTGFILTKMNDTAYAKRIIRRMFWLAHGKDWKQEKIHKDISND